MDQYIRGKVDEIDKRIDKISQRLDEHVANCTSRFLMLITIMLASMTIATTIIGMWLH